MWIISQIFFGIILPTIVSGVFFLLACRPWQKGEKNSRDFGIGGAAVGAGYAVGHVGIVGLPAFLPVEATQWIVYYALGGLVFSAMESFWEKIALLRLGLRFLFVELCLWFLLGPLANHSWGLLQASCHFAICGGAVLFFWYAADKLRDQIRETHLALNLLIVTSGGSLVLLLSGSASLGQLGGGLSAVVGASLILGVFYNRCFMTKTAVTVWVVLYATLVISGYFYADVPLLSALFLAVAPATVLALKRKETSVMKSWQAHMIPVAGAVLPIVLALIPVFANWPSQDYYG